MATRKHTLTQADVDRLAYDPDGPSRQVKWDGKVTGFGCRVTPGDGKQYVLSYRFNGRPRLMSLGPIDHFRNMAEARTKADALLHDLRHKGLDPMGSREQLSQAGTIAELWKVYTDQHLSLQSPHTQRTARSFWEAHIEPRIGHLKPQQVQSDELQRMHDSISRGEAGRRSSKARSPRGMARGGRVVANRVIQRLNAFFAWLKSRDRSLFPLGWENPAADVKRHREHARKHYLTTAQLSALAEALEEEASPWVRTYILLLALTGARKDEIRLLRWDDVDLGEGVARLAKTKSGESATLPLPPVAVEMLKALPVTPSTDYVFPGRPVRQPMIEPRRQFNAALERAGLPHTTFHDLRRSYGTALVDFSGNEKSIAAALRNTTSVAARHYIQIRKESVRELTEKHAESFLPRRVAHAQEE